MQLLKTGQSWIGTKMTISPKNIPYLYEDVLGLYKLGINHFIIGLQDGVELSLDEMEEYTNQLKKLYSWFNGFSHNDLKFDGDLKFDRQEESEELSSFGCEAGRNSICVNVNGEISPCAKVLALNDIQLIAKLGDIKLGIYNLSNRADLVSGIKLHSACIDNGIENDYQGGCYATNYMSNHDIFEPNIQDYIFSKMKKTIITAHIIASRRDYIGFYE
jgi:uncharacterized protein